MRKLNNTKEDREFLNSLLGGLAPKVKVTLGAFVSDTADSLTDFDYEGEVVDVDMESGYCNWIMQGRKMPFVNINCITII